LATVIGFAVLSALATWSGGGRTILDGVLLDLAVGARAGLFGTEEKTVQSPVALVAIDWRSLDSPELTPTPRALMQPVWTELLRAVLDAGGAKAVAFDALLVYSGNNLVRNYDRDFLMALRQYGSKVVLGRSAGRSPDRRYIASLQSGGGAFGLLEMQPDGDGIYRELRGFFTDSQGNKVDTLAAAAMKLADGRQMPDPVLLAPHRHPETLPTYPIVDVLRCAKLNPEALAKAFAGRIVFVGTTLPEEDRKLSTARFLTPPPETGDLPKEGCLMQELGASSPRATTTPGVHLHALAADAVLRDRLTQRISLAWSSVVAGLAGALGALASLLFSPAIAVAAMLGGALLLWGGETVLLHHYLWFPAGPAILALAAAVVVTYLGRYLLLERNREEIKAAFSRYLAPDVVEQLATDPTKLKLGGETKELTILFTDIRGFTTISEAYKSRPEELTSLINRLLSPLSREILIRRGTIDKYMGDCIMAFWNAPLDVPEHAHLGCDAALAMLHALDRLNAELQREAAAAGRPFIPLRVGVGLNTGDVVVGNMGSEERLEYSVLGDAVNLASRLEGQSRTYGVDIVIGETTTAEVPDYAVLELDLIAVKGKKEAVRIFTLLGNAERRQAPEFQKLETEHARMLEAFRRQDWQAALWHLSVCRELAPDLQEMYDMYQGRIAAYQAEPPGADWDGVFRATSK